jgi:site-specific DNA-cytosine methylase
VLAHGMMDHLDVTLAVDRWEKALAVYKANNREVECLAQDMSDPAVRQGLVRRLTELGVAVLMGGPPCQWFSSAGTRTTALGIEHLYCMLAVAVGTPCCRMMLFENVPGLVGTEELEGFLAVARIAGFDIQGYAKTSGRDCHLA